jgi:tight adherence protein C
MAADGTGDPEHRMSAALLGSVAGAAAVVLMLLHPRPLPRGRAPHRSTARRRSVAGSSRRRLFVAVVVAVAVTSGGPLLGCVAAIAMVIARRITDIRRQRNTTAAIAMAYPELVDLLVLTIGAGCSPLHAFTVLADVVPPALRSAVGSVARRTDAGERFADSVGHLRDPPLAGLGRIAQPLADALALADRHGTPLPPILDRLAAEAREHRRRQADIAARQLPIRLAFPLVGCTLPSFVLLTVVPLMAGTFSSLRGLTP